MKPPTIIEICRFLRAHAPGVRKGSPKGLAHFVGWYHRDGRAGVIREDGRIVAVALARCVEHPEQARCLDYAHEEHARLVWVQDIVSLHPRGIELLLAQAMRRFGPREAFCGRCFSRAGELRMLPWSTVERLTQEVRNGLNKHSGNAAAA